LRLIRPKSEGASIKEDLEMNRLVVIYVGIILAAILSVSSWAQCPEDTVDRGECDTLNVICLDCEEDTVEEDFYLVRFPLFVTHDQTQPSDSICGFVIPLTFTHSNPAAYCSVSEYWNLPYMLWVFPYFSTRSVFRHIVEDSDTLYYNRLAQLEGDFSLRGWDYVNIDLDGTSHFRLAVIATGLQDQRWWESERELLATMTFRVQDTMQICLDTTFWPPTSHLEFWRSDGELYVPRDNLPKCFDVRPVFAQDFTLDVMPNSQEVPAGGSVNYDAILTSIHGFSSPCTLTLSGLPTDASCSFDPNPVTPSDTAVMTISTLQTTPVGTYSLTITATEIGGTQIEHSAEVLLNVIVDVPPCPEDTVDRGECDTLHVTCYDCERDTSEVGPYFVQFPLFVTHDQTRPNDSIGAFIIPLSYTHTNPSAYCSLSQYWNTSWMLWVFPDFSTRSIFRHITEGSDTLYHNRFAQMGADFSGREWDTVILDLDGTSHFWLTVFATGSQDQLWWEGERVLLATMTFRVQDTMQICLDTTFWPPNANLTFYRMDGGEYVPRDNLPHCFSVGPKPDFTIEVQPGMRKVLAGNSIWYDIMITPLFGFESPCSLAVSGLPSGASASFDPNPANPLQTSVMTVQTLETTPPGIYDLIITATEIGGEGIQHEAQVVLSVSILERLVVTAYPGVDLVVTDPMGKSISCSFNSIQNAIYDETHDVNGDGQPDDQVIIPQPLMGEYHINVIGEDEATDADNFYLAVKLDDYHEVLLVSNAPVPPIDQTAEYSYEILPYVSGDANGDRTVGPADVVWLINYLFRAGSAPSLLDAGDVNCDTKVGPADVVYLINYLFRDGESPGCD
jgi:hypothetical protein